MTDLLKPDEVREIHSSTFGPFREMNRDRARRLCRDYLTLWDELEHEREISDKAVKRVTQLEQEIATLMQ